MKLNRDKVKELLERPGQNYSAVARSVGITPSAIYAIRDGVTIPSADTVGGMAKHYGKPVGWFYDEEAC